MFPKKDTYANRGFLDSFPSHGIGRFEFQAMRFFHALSAGCTPVVAGNPGGAGGFWLGKERPGGAPFFGVLRPSNRGMISHYGAFLPQGEIGA